MERSRGMEKHMEVIHQILALTDTMEEGLGYIREKLNGNSLTQAATMLFDVTHSYATVESALQSLSDQLPENNIQTQCKQLRSSLSAMVDDLKHNQGHRGLEIFQFVLEPAFKKWQAELKG